MQRLIPLLLLMLLACTPQAIREPDVPPETTQDELNTKIGLKQSLGMNDVYDAMGTINLYLVNLSNNAVVFPANFNAEIYVQQDQDWTQVKNSYGYPTGDKVLPTTEAFPPGLIVAVKPDLTQITIRPVILRITVTGTLENSDKEVGAYIDVTIE